MGNFNPSAGNRNGEIIGIRQTPHVTGQIKSGSPLPRTEQKTDVESAAN
ncbi:MAG: hypothetical protein H3C35_00455 [Bacteroidetes bacterium]|nr:hypothetical protein [Bacteroidota bacterium]